MASHSKFQKEGRHGTDHQVPIQDSRRRKRRDDPKNHDNISGLGNLINRLLKNDLVSYLEPLVRRVVREEVERLILAYSIPRATLNVGGTGTSGAKPLELRIINKLPDAIFTLSNILADDGNTPIQIALFDVRSQSVVNNGPLSSIKVEIYALNGEFECEDWTEEEFQANILRQREGKEPLLNGDRFISLQNGVGCIKKLKITDNSSWIRSRKIILGVKAVETASSCGVSIKEGKSEPFVVKDNRGELYKKHHPPSLKDDIWRLEKIAKDGIIHKRLSLHGINTVKDLLQLYIINPSSLREKVGKIPKKSWMAMTEHAEACVIDDYNLYMYSAAEQPVGLLFNSIYKLVGVTFDGLNYHSPDTLNPYQKRLVEMVKQHAYQNVNTLTCLQNEQAGAPNFSIARQDQVETWAGSDQQFSSTSCIDEGTYNSEFYVNPSQHLNYMSQYGSEEGEFFSGMHIEGNSWPHIGSVFTEDESAGIQFTTLGQENNGLLYSGCYGEAYFRGDCGVGTSSNGKPKAVWYKVRTALKWVISVRRDAAARRMAKLIRYHD